MQSPTASNDTQPGQINVNCSYITDTTDKGVFVIVHSNTPDVHVYQPGYRNNSTNTILEINVFASNNYTVIPYDLETSGIPKELPASRPLKVFVEGEY